MRSDGASCRLGVDRLHTQQNDRRIVDRGYLSIRSQSNVALEVAALEEQTVTLDRLHMLPTPNQCHRHTGACEHSSEVTADRSCSDNPNALDGHDAMPEAEAASGRWALQRLEGKSRCHRFRK